MEYETILALISRIESKLDKALEGVSENSKEIERLKTYRETDSLLIRELQRRSDEAAKRLEALEQERARIRLIVALIGFLGAAIGSALAQVVTKSIAP